jgi:ABC-2 type transport system ATP-binding protein
VAAANDIPRARVDAVLDIAGIADIADRRIRSYSLGMKQRLGIAAALLGDPPILIFDEPVNGLDPEGVLWIRRLMRAMAAEGRTVLVSSHLLGEIELTADHLIILGRGRLLADTAISQLVTAEASLEAAYMQLTDAATEFRAVS